MTADADRPSSKNKALVMDGFEVVGAEIARLSERIETNDSKTDDLTKQVVILSDRITDTRGQILRELDDLWKKIEARFNSQH